MKKKLFWLPLLAMLLQPLTGCMVPPAPVTPPDPTAAQTQAPTQPPLSLEDTYWVAYEYFDEEHKEMRPTETVGWYIDLFILADGTARLRDIHNELCIMDDDGLHLQWQQSEDGGVRMYNAAYEAPLLEGRMENGVLALSYRGTPITLKPELFPQTVGEMYCPAELTGTWVAFKAMTEGYEWELMPASFETMLFHPDPDTMDLVADLEYRGYLGCEMFAYRSLPLEILDEPIYPGCGNEQWQVRLGTNDKGQPVGKTLSVTLVDRNVLVLQSRHTVDGSPAVSYTTYLRASPALTWWDVTARELANTNWYCSGYLDPQGTMSEPPAEFREQTLVLGEDGSCWLGEKEGTWLITQSGSFAIYAKENPDGIWGYGGAIRASYAGGEEPFYELYLLHGGGLLRFLIESYG